MDKSKYNIKCTECGCDAYLGAGFAPIECSNSACKFYKKPEVEDTPKESHGVYDDPGYHGEPQIDGPSMSPDSGNSVCPPDGMYLKNIERVQNVNRAKRAKQIKNSGDFLGMITVKFN